MEHDRKMLERGERLLAKATAGPWKADKNQGCRKIKGAKSDAHRQAQHTEIAYTTGLSNDAEDRANAELIAFAVTSLPRLIELASFALRTQEKTKRQKAREKLMRPVDGIG